MDELARRLDLGQPPRQALADRLLVPERLAEGGTLADMIEGQADSLARSAIAMAPITSRSVWKLAMIE